MKKFLLGLLSGFVMAGLAAVILVFALMRASDRRQSGHYEARQES